jgi:hypothetical protein
LPGRETEPLPEAADEVLRVGEAAEAGDIGHIVAQVAEEVHAALEPYAVHVRTEVTLGVRMKKPREVIWVPLEKSRGAFAAEPGI